MKIKIPKHYCASTRHIQSFPRVSFVYSEKWRWSSIDKPYVTENVIVRSSYDPLGQNKNSESLLHIFLIVYSWRCKCNKSDKLYRKKETSFFDPYLTPWDKMKIPKSYCTSSRHFKSSMKCRQSSGDSNFTENVIFGL